MDRTRPKPQGLVRMGSGNLVTVQQRSVLANMSSSEENQLFLKLQQVMVEAKE